MISPEDVANATLGLVERTEHVEEVPGTPIAEPTVPEGALLIMAGGRRSHAPGLGSTC